MTTPKLSAGLIVVRRFEDGWRCLVLRVYRNWDLPKGAPEGGEAPLVAALREAAEETGLRALELPWGVAYRETPVYARGKVARIYLALSREGDVVLPVSAELGRPEHHAFRWVSFAEAERLLPQRFLDIVRWARETVEDATG